MLNSNIAAIDGLLVNYHKLRGSSNNIFVRHFNVRLPRFMQPIHEIYGLIANDKKKIAITMHQKPDADAMGSTLGLYHFLIQFGHEVTVISPTNWASFLNWMPGCEKVM